MHHPHRIYPRARAIAVTMPVAETKRVTALSALTLGAITSIIVYIVAALLS